MEIDEPVLVDLISSKPMQRLKRIMEAPTIVNPKESYNRYQHCVGVAILLKRFNATLDEQVSGLLHDVSHTAFSHMVDWALGDVEKQDYQDRTHKEFIKGTEIPEILEKHGIDLDTVADTKRYGLLERELPDICADRLDYGMRNFEHWENPAAVKPCLDGLTTRNNEFVFNSKEAARIFAENYLKCQTGSWGDLDSTIRAHVFANVIRIALKSGTISLKDLYTYDRYVMGKLEGSSDGGIKLLMKILREGVEYTLVSKEPDLINKKKIRYTDPLFTDGGGTSRLSHVDSEYHKMLDAYLKTPNALVKFDYPKETVALLL